MLNYSPKNARNLKPEAVPTINLLGLPAESQKANNEKQPLQLAKSRQPYRVKDIKASISDKSNSMFNNHPHFEVVYIIEDEIQETSAE